jgi:hypothetical protein
MKSLTLTLTLAVLAFCASAQTDDTSGERERIRGARADVQAQYAVEERACYGRFAVNNCLDKAKARRNDALTDLRRQELALNEEDRKRKLEQRQRELDERNSPERQLSEQLRREEAVAAQRERQAQAAEKAAQRAADVAKRAAKANGRPVPQPASGAASGPAAAPSAAASRAGGLKTQQPTGDEAARNRAEYEARVKEAQERKARVLQGNAQKAKPAASALPAPPS